MHFQIRTRVWAHYTANYIELGYPARATLRIEEARGEEGEKNFVSKGAHLRWTQRRNYVRTCHACARAIEIEWTPAWWPEKKREERGGEKEGEERERETPQQSWSNTEKKDVTSLCVFQEYCRDTIEHCVHYTTLFFPCRIDILD